MAGRHRGSVATECHPSENGLDQRGEPEGAFVRHHRVGGRMEESEVRRRAGHGLLPARVGVVLLEVATEHVHAEMRPLWMATVDAGRWTPGFVGVLSRPVRELLCERVGDLKALRVAEERALLDQVPEQHHRERGVVIGLGQRVLDVIEPIGLVLAEVCRGFSIRESHALELAQPGLLASHVVHGHELAVHGPSEAEARAIPDRRVPVLDLHVVLDVPDRLEPAAELDVHNPAGRQLAIRRLRRLEFLDEHLRGAGHPCFVAAAHKDYVTTVAVRVVKGSDHVSLSTRVLEVEHRVPGIIERTDGPASRTVAQRDQVALDGHCGFGCIVSDDWRPDSRHSLDGLLDGRSRLAVDTGSWCDDRDHGPTVSRQIGGQIQILEFLVDGRNRLGRRLRDLHTRDKSHVIDDDLGGGLVVRVKADLNGLRALR